VVLEVDFCLDSVVPSKGVFQIIIAINVAHPVAFEMIWLAAFELHAVNLVAGIPAAVSVDLLMLPTVKPGRCSCARSHSRKHLDLICVFDWKLAGGVGLAFPHIPTSRATLCKPLRIVTTTLKH
jgi:hypothetical protein